MEYLSDEHGYYLPCQRSRKQNPSCLCMWHVCLIVNAPTTKLFEVQTRKSMCRCTLTISQVKVKVMVTRSKWVQVCLVNQVCMCHARACMNFTLVGPSVHMNFAQAHAQIHVHVHIYKYTTCIYLTVKLVLGYGSVLNNILFKENQHSEF